MSRFGWSTSNYLDMTPISFAHAPVTLAAWVRPTAFNTSYIMATWAAGGSNNCVQIRMESSGVVSIQWTTALFLSTTAAMTLNKWHHVCVWAHPTLGGAVYLDGSKGKASSGTTGNSFTATHLLIGITGSTSTPTAPLNAGDIGEASMWTDVLTDAEIDKLAMGLDPRMIRREQLKAHVAMMGGPTFEVNDVNLGLPSTVIGALSQNQDVPRLYKPRRPWPISIPSYG